MKKPSQRALMQYKNPANRSLVLEGLKIAGRMDLVGFGRNVCSARRETEGKNPAEIHQEETAGSHRTRDVSPQRKRSAIRIRKNKELIDEQNKQ